MWQATDDSAQIRPATEAELTHLPTQVYLLFGVRTSSLARPDASASLSELPAGDDDLIFFSKQTCVSEETEVGLSFFNVVNSSVMHLWLH